MRPPTPLLLACLLMAPLLAPAATAVPLSIDEPAEVTLERPAVFEFTAPTDGMLVLLTRSTKDVSMQVVGPQGQDLLQGAGDMDWAGNPGSERAIHIMQAGDTVSVTLISLDGPGAATLIARFSELEGVEPPPPDPQGTPDQAIDLPLNEWTLGRLDPNAGDANDWYRITCDAAGYLVIVTDKPGSHIMFSSTAAILDTGNADIAIEVFSDVDFTNPQFICDGDTQGQMLREAAAMLTNPRKVFYLRVSGSAPNGYALHATILPLPTTKLQPLPQATQPTTADPPPAPKPTRKQKRAPFQ